MTLITEYAKYGYNMSYSATDRASAASSNLIKLKT